MRIVKEIPHPQFKISIFSWNDKYSIKIEIGTFEQVYKIKHSDVEGLAQVEQLIDETFLKGVMDRFLAMRTDFSETFKRNTI